MCAPSISYCRNPSLVRKTIGIAYWFCKYSFTDSHRSQHTLTPRAFYFGYYVPKLFTRSTLKPRSISIGSCGFHRNTYGFTWRNLNKQLHGYTDLHSDVSFVWVTCIFLKDFMMVTVTFWMDISVCYNCMQINLLHFNGRQSLLMFGVCVSACESCIWIFISHKFVPARMRFSIQRTAKYRDITWLDITRWFVMRGGRGGLFKNQKILVVSIGDLNELWINVVFFHSRQEKYYVRFHQLKNTCTVFRIVLALRAYKINI